MENRREEALKNDRRGTREEEEIEYFLLINDYCGESVLKEIPWRVGFI